MSSLSLFVYNWELSIEDNLPIIIGFGYNKNDEKVAIAVTDFPLYKYTKSFHTDSRNPFNLSKRYEKQSRRLLRQYLKGEQEVYKIYFNDFKEYSKFYSNLFNVDIVSAFLVDQNLDTIGWVKINNYNFNQTHHYTTFHNEYIVSYKNILSENINSYPESSILSFDIECMSHDFVSFPNRYEFEDYISTISLVYNYKNTKRHLAICVKYNNKTNIINKITELDKVDSNFIPFIDLTRFNESLLQSKIIKPSEISMTSSSINSEKDTKVETNSSIPNNNNLKNTKLNHSSKLNERNLKNKEKDIDDNNIDDKKNKESVKKTMDGKSVLKELKTLKCNKESTSTENVNNANLSNPMINTFNNDSINKPFNGPLNEPINETMARYNRLKSILSKSETTMSNTETRYHRLKNIINSSCILSKSENIMSNTETRYHRLKNIINASLNYQPAIKNRNDTNEYSNYEEIEKFIESHEKSKKKKVLKTTEIQNDYDIIFVESEYELLCEFFKQIRALDPDVIIGYNTFGFDYKYIGQRAGMYLIIDSKDSPFTASRILNKFTKFKSLSNDEIELSIPGRIAIDMYKYAKSLNLNSASLDYVSEQLLNQRKIDLPYKEMFYLIDENTEEALNRVAQYCIMDSILTLNIFNTSHQWIQLLEIAKISRIRIDEIYKEGQSKKFSNLLYKYCIQYNICIDMDKSNIEGYKGATVIEPLSGVYNYCTMLDFTSLYPSVIITHNICYTTLLNKNEIKKDSSEDSYYKIDIGDKVYYYTKEHEGILPRLMNILLTERIKYKNLLKTVSGVDYVIYDKRQYALKIQANSIYGCLGSSSLKYLRFLPGAECTTGMGRNYLNKTIDIIQRDTNFRVIYGDTDSCLIEYKKEKDNINNNDNENSHSSVDSGQNDNHNIDDKSHPNNDNNNINESFTVNPEQFIKESIEVANHVTKLLPKGMHLKYENTFSRMVILSKKKYSGILVNNSELYIKGIDIVKKNTCIFVRNYFKIFLYMILFNYPEKLIRNKIKEMKKTILSGNVSLENLIMRLSIGSKYKLKSNPISVFIGNHKKYNLDYKAGEKVNYVIVDPTSFSFNENSHLLGDHMMSIDLYNNICENASVDPSVVIPKIDYDYYYDHYIKNGFKSLLECYNPEIANLL